MRRFTTDELKQYDGRDGTAYVACEGKVYDVFGSLLWKGDVIVRDIRPGRISRIACGMRRMVSSC